MGAVMKMISIKKQQREEIKKSRASSTAQSLPTIDENVDKRSNIRLSERPSSDSLSSFISLGSSEGDMSLEIEEVMKLMQEIGSLNDSDMQKAQEGTNVFHKDYISNKNISQNLSIPPNQSERSSPTNQEHNTKLNTTSEHKLEVNTDSSMSINHQNINTRQIIQPKDPCTHSDTQALLGCDSMHTTEQLDNVSSKPLKNNGNCIAESKSISKSSCDSREDYSTSTPNDRAGQWNDMNECVIDENILPINIVDPFSSSPYRERNAINRSNMMRAIAQMDNRIPLRFVTNQL